MKQSESVKALLESFAKAQAKFPTLPKDKSGYGYKYTDLDTVISTVRPILAENGLGFMQTLGALESGKSAITTRVFNTAGEWIEDTVPLPDVAMAKTNAAQNLGAAITYMKRYALCAMLGMSSDEDVDANPDMNAGQRKPLTPEAMGMKKASQVKSRFSDSETAEMKKWADGTFTPDELAKVKAELNGDGWAEAFNKAKAEYDKRKAGNPPEEIF
jgi:hypothetical protein